MLHLLALFPDGRLQRAAHSLAISTVLRRFARSILCCHVRDLSPALLDEHRAFLASRAAVSLRCAQWRNQHHRLESPLVAGQGAQHPRAPDRRFVVPPPRRKRQRFREFRQRLRAALASLSQGSEPWDGPAALVFSDGQFVGAKLDRNGLRPMRYTLTHDGLLMAGSETGLIDLDEFRIAERQRLGPGEMVLANPATGSFLRWREILKHLASQGARSVIPQPRAFVTGVGVPHSGVAQPKRIAAAAGWTEDQFKILF